MTFKSYIQRVAKLAIQRLYLSKIQYFQCAWVSGAGAFHSGPPVYPRFLRHTLKESSLLGRVCKYFDRVKRKTSIVRRFVQLGSAL